jgi:O-antigen/teichoic acid export membrane protein
MFQDLKKYYREPLYRNSLSIMLTQVFATFFALAFWMVAARTMSSTTVGLATAAFSSTVLLISLAPLGLDAGLTRFLPGSNNKRGLYSTTMLITLLSSLALMTIFLSGLQVLSPQLVFLREGWSLVALIGFAAVTAVSTMQATALIAARQGHLYFIQNTILGLRVPLIIVFASLGTVGVFLSWDVAFLATVLFGTVALYYYGLSMKWQIDVTSLREIFRFSLGNYTAGIFQLAPLIIPVMIINAIGAREGAYYYIAHAVAAGLLFIIPAAVGLSLFVEGSHGMPLRETAIKSLKFTMLILIPAIAVIFLLGDRLLLLFGSQYSTQALELLWLLAVTSLLSVIPSIYSSIVTVQKNIKMLNYVNFAISALMLGAAYPLLLTYGIIGVGYAWVISYALVSIIVVWLVIRRDRWL